MSSADVGGSVAWRVLATLEGGAALIATSALLALTARSRRRRRPPAKTALITNTTSDLGKELKRQLETHGCTVSTVTSGADTGAGAGEVDALIIVGATPFAASLDGMAELVTEDIHNNLTILDSLSNRVRRGGYIAWTCVGTSAGPYSGAINAFDAALKASLQHAAKRCECEAVWVGRCDSAALAAERTIASLVHSSHAQRYSAFSIRNAASKISNYIGRWLKIIT